MRVIGIISSPSRNGNTAVLVREALSGAASSGAEVEEIVLAEHNLRYCTGCGECLVRGRCGLPDGFEEIRQKIYAADGIVLGSPTYCADLNATMKNLFDRLGMLAYLTSALGGKYAVGISTASGNGADAVARKLADMVGSTAIFARGYSSGTLGVLRHGKRVDEQPAALARARALGSKLADDIRRRRGYPFQNLPGRLIAALFVRKNMERSIAAFRHGPMKAAYENLVARGLVRPVDDERIGSSEQPARGR
jgi:multimeric flavodoxin WrbA